VRNSDREKERRREEKIKTAKVLSGERESERVRGSEKARCKVRFT